MNELYEIAAAVRRKIPWMTISAGVVNKHRYGGSNIIRAKHHATGFDESFFVTHQDLSDLFATTIADEAELAAGYFLRRFDEWLWSEDRQT